MPTSAKPNVNAYWEHVKSMYPDARFNFWYSIGELHFYRDGKAEANDPDGDYVSSCFKKDGKFTIQHHSKICPM